MLLFRCKMKKVGTNDFLYLLYCFCFLASVLFNNRLKNVYIVIINIVIHIENGSLGNN